jgi:hypothetical protein
MGYIESGKCTQAEDLPAGPQLVFTLNNRFFRHQACYSLLPAKPGGQADRVISLCKYKVVGFCTQENAVSLILTEA